MHFQMDMFFNWYKRMVLGAEVAASSYFLEQLSRKCSQRLHLRRTNFSVKLQTYVEENTSAQLFPCEFGNKVGGFIKT